jgi:putative peptidoglycan lipid II flippase
MRPPDLDATAATLVFFTLGLFGWGAQYILARGFYATRNTLIPAIVGTVLTFANLPVYWLLVRRAQHLGLAMASSIGILAYTVILFALLGRRTHNREEGAMVRFFLKVCVASTLVGAVCYKLRQMLEPHLAWHTLPGALSLLVAVTAVGILALVIIGKLMGIRELDEQLARLWLLAPWRRSKTPA